MGKNMKKNIYAYKYGVQKKWMQHYKSIILQKIGEQALQKIKQINTKPQNKTSQKDQQNLSGSRRLQCFAKNIRAPFTPLLRTQEHVVQKLTNSFFKKIKIQFLHTIFSVTRDSINSPQTHAFPCYSRSMRIQIPAQNKCL